MVEVVADHARAAECHLRVPCQGTIPGVKEPTVTIDWRLMTWLFLTAGWVGLQVASRRGAFDVGGGRSPLVDVGLLVVGGFALAAGWSYTRHSAVGADPGGGANPPSNGADPLAQIFTRHPRVPGLLVLGALATGLLARMPLGLTAVVAATGLADFLLTTLLPIGIQFRLKWLGLLLIVFAIGCFGTSTPWLAVLR